MKPSKKTLLLLGLVALLLAAVAATAYMMWQCSKGDGSRLAEPFDGGPDQPKEGGTKAEYFAMGGCPHCEAFDPVWQAAEEKLNGSESASGLSLHRWDIKTDEGHQAAKAAGVTAFPHVQKTRPDGSVEVFNGKRTEDELLKFLEN